MKIITGNKARRQRSIFKVLKKFRFLLNDGPQVIMAAQSEVKPDH